MPAEDFYHDAVRTALIKDGWTITDDPLRLKLGARDLFVDLAAERLLAAERAGRRIAVEVKSFLGASQVYDVEHALGQYTLYHEIMTESHSDHVLYLAIRHEVYEDLFAEPLGRMITERLHIPVVTFDWKQEVIVQWID